MDSPPPLRARRRAQLTKEIRRTALRLFARHGFDAVTVDDIVAAAAISKSTFFRVVAGKDSLLVDPLLENVAAVVAAFAARPATEQVTDALIAAMVDRVTAAESADIELWCTAIRTAPHLLGRVALIGPDDRAALIEAAARRMGTSADPATDPRPGLLVTVALAAGEFAFRTWITAPGETPLPELVENALRTVLTPDWTTR
ncbi:AcrR family transcriptional regulator [Nocardia transvalensis]|uniref:AcrR family transcriptional regulator n=1 Tax=Nocardia transvalensis TaxID=37333 RepID=A0A7W9UK89_9NOCA|nr:TetR family transcriptional regulator [Nocardia transvalensis]MBB5916186.1 AcrR family transcriptional regulator [Nocardia transvalensis]